MFFQNFAYVGHDAVVVKVIVAGNGPNMLMSLWLDQFILTDATVYRHQLPLINGHTLATIGLYV